MDIKVKKEPFDRELEVPTSKSYINRLLILASLFPQYFTLRHINFCDDVLFLIKALKQIGLNIEINDSTVLIKNQFPACENEVSSVGELDLGDGGTTVRFLLPFLAKGKKVYKLKLGDQIRKRPLAPLIDLMISLGAVCEWKDECLFVQGPLVTSKPCLVVDTSQTSQFASALALAFAPEKIEVKITNDELSLDYFRLTKKIILDVQSGKSDFEIPVDFSSLAYPLALGLSLGRVLVKNCFALDLYQADSIFISLLEELGGKPKFTSKGLELFHIKSFKKFEKNCQNCQDLVPVLAFLAALVSEESCLSGLENLRHKETDRIKMICDVLDLFFVNWRFDELTHSLYISKGNKVAPFLKWSSVPDHRIIMMVYLFMRVHDGGEILNAEFVSKSYPLFFDSINT